MLTGPCVILLTLGFPYFLVHMVTLLGVIMCKPNSNELGAGCSGVGVSR